MGQHGRDVHELTVRERVAWGELFSAAGTLLEDEARQHARLVRNRNELAAVFRDMALLASTGSLTTLLDAAAHIRLVDGERLDEPRHDEGELFDGLAHIADFLAQGQRVKARGERYPVDAEQP